MPDTESLNSKFTALERRLFKGSLNYVIAIRVYTATGVAGRSAKEIVQSAIGDKAVLGGCFSVTYEEALKEIEYGIDYRGSDGAHPSLSFLESPEFSSMRSEILSEVQALFSSATQIIGF